MKRALLRIAGILCIGIGMYFEPLLFLVGGGLAFGIFFLSALEAVLFAFMFEFLTLTPSGLVAFPLASAIFLQRRIALQMPAGSFLSSVIQYGAGILCFFLIHALVLFLYEGISVFAQPMLFFGI